MSHLEKNKLLILKKYKNIFFIGFMGVGKTTISTKLSFMLKMKLVDIDYEIKSKMHMNIDEIFEVYGEDFFRDKETFEIKNYAKGSGSIISCGGGSVKRIENINEMKKNGLVVLLKASPKTIFNRLKNTSGRPLLKNNMTLSYIKDLMNERNELYEKAANIIIDTENKCMDCICIDIVYKIIKNK